MSLIDSSMLLMVARTIQRELCSSKQVSPSAGQNLRIEVTINQLNLSPLYTSVNHTTSHDNEYLKSSSKTSGSADVVEEILKNFCSHPVPLMYHVEGEVLPGHRFDKKLVKADEIFLAIDCLTSYKKDVVYSG
ncbi:hypothetical protein HELRODRAFT_160372 [Helobdella robusta]|uniref:Uncharacterized protein n=1 Tax=Helobdella robusta TaxID=6412 RepID=T1EQ57_HELRO|nr:hypothetical protein HELRODRAFT_160372 [Helobdella robusta]ESO06214.1 hypothetical protein HELRODRAFT_160372 [Helobdella robusta]